MKTFVPSLLKEENSQLIYNLFLNGEKSYSKAEISRATGISAPTVMKIVDSFVEKGILVDIGEGESAVGRKPNMLSLNARAYYAVGVDFQNGFIRVGVADLKGELIDFEKQPIQTDFDDLILTAIYESIAKMQKKYHIPTEKILGVGLGLPGVVDVKKRTVEYAAIPGFDGFVDLNGILERFEKKTTWPVYVENDINAAAIGEFKSCRFKKANDLLYISLGTGIGAGLILNGEVRHGVHNFAGEIAYTSFDAEYDTKYKKVGWLETVVDTPKMIENSKRLQGDAKLDEKLKKNCKVVALCVANLSVLLDIDFVVVGGIAAEFYGTELIESLEQELARMSLFDISLHMPVSVVPELVGCAALVCEHRMKETI